MGNEPTEEELAKLAKEFGLNKPNFFSEFFGNPWFHGDFGHSINLRFVIIVLILIFISIFLLIYKKKKRK